MWRNYLTVGLRALAKSRAYAAINIVGLALGLAACLMILLYVRYETNHDAWLKDGDRVFQLQTLFLPNAQGNEEDKMQMSAIAPARALLKDFPQQIVASVYIRSFSPIVIQDGRPTKIDKLRMVDGDFFGVFDIPFVRGSAATALPDTHSIALSESEAMRRFGTLDAVGKTLTIVDNSGDIDYRVTGVFKDWPKDSSFTANAVARFDLATQFADRPGALTSYTNQGGWNYLKLRRADDADTINANMAAWEKRNIPDTPGSQDGDNPGLYQDYRLENIRANHLSDAQNAAPVAGNDRATVLTFAVIALLVLGMACVNFTNLATARASSRAREVALRKVLGASRRQLIAQFLGESVLVAAIAMLIALAAVELLLPAFNDFLGAGIVMHYVGADGVLLPAIALVLIVGVLAGLYPAVYLARFEPARILKANKSAADAQGSGRLRSALVVVQFAVSIGLTICTAVIYGQTVYARNADAGYVRDGLLQVSNLGYRGVDGRDAQVVEQIRRIPGVIAAARTQIAIDPGSNSVGTVERVGTDTAFNLGNYAVESGFFKAMGMKLIAGRDFSEAQGRDDTTTPSPADPGFAAAARTLVQRGANVVITADAARRLGFASPASALGAQLTAGLLPIEYGMVPITVVGVVEDARFRSIRDPLQPILYYSQRTDFSDIVVRFNGNPATIREQVEAVWNRNIPNVPFRGRFADDIVRDQYDREAARGQLFAAFSVLAVVIGCLGLFGLAAFTAERRTKEIGIRKVLGARTRDIVRLLVWQFSRPVLIANVIAWPIAWWLMRDWLNGFDVRVALTPVPFVAAGLLAVVIAVVTVAGHAYRVAQTSPVRALRYE
ncbi:FtsX-like permease family protein [Sphingomonas floccifaciens]|uniref:FtsX-like permease family protein n=1 Tax=Sphingomonas floccifaciens TaxID=1844115 RepID=A0ABW4NAE4_9SPHN